MKKAEFVRMVADRTGLKKKDTEATLDAVLESIGDVLASGDKLNFIGFGSFETKQRTFAGHGKIRDDFSRADGGVSSRKGIEGKGRRFWKQDIKNAHSREETLLCA